jgi:hypothetical protein
MLTVKITPNDKGNPPGKLADVELHFTDPTCPDCQGDRELTVADSGPLAGAVGTCARCNGHGVLVGANPVPTENPIRGIYGRPGPPRPLELRGSGGASSPMASPDRSSGGCVTGRCL